MLTENDVEWLTKSELFASFDFSKEDIVEDDLTFSILKLDHLCKSDINCLDDFVSAILAIQYWMVYDIPESIIQYGATHVIDYNQFPININIQISSMFLNLYELFNLTILPMHDYHPDACPWPCSIGFKNCVRIDFYRVLCRSETVLRDNLCYYAADMGNIECLIYAHTHKCPWNVSVSSIAAYRGNLDCLKYAIENCCKFDIFTLSAAAKCGHLNCLRYIYDNHYKDKSNKYQNADLVEDVVYGGHIDCLQYIYNCLSSDHKTYLRSKTQLCKAAVYDTINNSVECLRFLHNIGCPWSSDVCSAAVMRGNLKCLQYAFENGCPWNDDICTDAVWNSSPLCLQYLHEKNCKWDEDTCCTAVQMGSIECLKYAHEHGCPWDVNTCKAAIYTGRWECYQYASENGCPLEKDSLYALVTHGRSFECFEYAFNCLLNQDNINWTQSWKIFDIKMDMDYNNIRSSQHDDLTISAVNGVVIDIQTLLIAILHKSPFEIDAYLQYMSSKMPIQWDSVVMFVYLHGSMHGSISCLKFAHLKGGTINMTNELCKKVCRHDNNNEFHCMKYIHTNIQKCQWDATTCAHAAQYGNLNLLIFAHTNGCPWDNRTCTEAAAANNLQCLKYAHENGCPWDKGLCTIAAKNGSLECLQYAYANGCHWSRKMSMIANNYTGDLITTNQINIGYRSYVQQIMQEQKKKSQIFADYHQYQH